MISPSRNAYKGKQMPQRDEEFHQIHKGKVDHTPVWSVGRVLISLLVAHKCINIKEPKPVMHGQCDARPTVTFLAARHHHPLAGTKLYCLVTEAHGC